MRNRPKPTGRKYAGYEISECIWDLKTRRYKKNPDYKKPRQYQRFIIPAIAVIAIILLVRLVFFELS
jgi:hypothetical protein